MNKYFLIILVAFLVLGCSKSDENNAEKSIRLKNSYVEYLFFDDDIRYALGTTFFTPVSGTKDLLTFNYKNNTPCNINGGYWPPYSENNLTWHTFKSEAQDEITINSSTNSFDVTPSYYQSQDSTNLTFTFSIDQNNNLLKITQPNGNSLNYTYLKDLIVEKDSSGKITRNFYFENKNLIRVTKIIGDSLSGNYLIKEIKFNSYDNSPNPFKNRFYLQGAFYRSFSVNNYIDCYINTYEVKNGVSQGLISQEWRPSKFTYNSRNYPIFGEYEEY